VTASASVYISFLIITPMMLVDGINQMLEAWDVCGQIPELVILGIIPFCRAFDQPLLNV